MMNNKPVPYFLPRNSQQMEDAMKQTFEDLMNMHSQDFYDELRGYTDSDFSKYESNVFDNEMEKLKKRLHIDSPLSIDVFYDESFFLNANLFCDVFISKATVEFSDDESEFYERLYTLGNIQMTILSGQGMSITFDLV